MTLTKSDFLQYLEAPMHLWAKKQGQLLDLELSDYDKHLISQGYEVESLAQDFLKQKLETANYTLNFQSTVKDGEYQARIDALGFDKQKQVYNIYEVKSVSEVKKEHIWDAGFQWLIAQKSLPIRTVNLVYLNKEYVRNGSLDLNELFVIQPVDSDIQAIQSDLLQWMKDAFDVAKSDNCSLFDGCLKPKDCPCLDLCHPNLPEYSIFDIARINKTKAQKLKDEGILDIQDVPKDFKLSKKQEIQVQAAQSNNILINKPKIAYDLEKLKYPLYFLDYETFPSALPLFNGYHPHQHQTFQYSLHIVSDADGALHDDTQITHKEFLAISQDDPGKLLVEKMKQDIGDTGSVLVWNKTFECSRNKEMAELYPEYKNFLINLNDRVYDLGDPFNKCWYVDPKFKGSWSIKNVLPVLVPELSYDGMKIGKGDQAMLAWWKMVYGDSSLTAATKGHKQPVSHNHDLEKDMLKYCELDTWAMVKIWRKLMNF